MPYYPATNGLAERCVESFKNGMKSETEVKSLNIKLAKFLLAYRNAPHSTTGEPPSQLSLGRRILTRLDLLKPDLSIQVNNRQIYQSVAKGGSGTRHFFIGQRVIARNSCPTITENHGDQAADSSEQSDATSRETVDQSANSVAEYLVSTPPSQVEHVHVKRYPTRVRKPPARLDL